MCNSKLPINFARVQEKCSLREHPVFLALASGGREATTGNTSEVSGPKQGEGQGGLSPPPLEIFRIELNSPTKVEFFY